MNIELVIHCMQEPGDTVMLTTAGGGEALFLDLSADATDAGCIQLSEESAEQLRDALTQWLERAR